MKNTLYNQTLRKKIIFIHFIIEAILAIALIFIICYINIFKSSIFKNVIIYVLALFTTNSLILFLLFL